MPKEAHTKAAEHHESTKRRRSITARETMKKDARSPAKLRRIRRPHASIPKLRTARVNPRSKVRTEGRLKARPYSTLHRAASPCRRLLRSHKPQWDRVTGTADGVHFSPFMAGGRCADLGGSPRAPYN
jgi:hypothetical protein